MLPLIVISMNEVLLIIPAYNESESIKKVVTSAKKYIKNILVIDDGSTDSTTEEIKNTNITLIKNKTNRGKGCSLRKGFDYAIQHKYDIVITMDADGEHNANNIPLLLKKLKKSEIVVGERDRFRSKNRKLLNYWTNLWVRSVLPNIEDTQCGFRAVKTNLLKKMNLTSDNFEIELEMLLEALKNKAKITTTTITYYPVKTSKMGFNDYIKINNLFDRWIIKNNKFLKVGKFKKIGLIISAYCGLAIGSIFEK